MSKTQVHTILVISLSNIGDVVLTFPVMDLLFKKFPEAQVEVVVGPKAAGLLRGNPAFCKIHIFDKRQTLRKTAQWIRSLRVKKYDLVVDLRNTMIPFLLKARKRTPPFLNRKKGEHMLMQHLRRLQAIVPFSVRTSVRRALFVSEPDRIAVDNQLRAEGGLSEGYFVVAPGAADRGKRWNPERFAQVTDILSVKQRMKSVFIGDAADKETVRAVTQQMKSEYADLSGRTNLSQMAYLIQKSAFVIVNDSASMHIASYLNVPTLALFGPTDPKKYGPWGSVCAEVKKELTPALLARLAPDVTNKEMQPITVQDVLSSFDEMSRELGLEGVA